MIRRLPALRLAAILALMMSLAAEAGTLVRFHTVFGDILVELYDSEKPATVGNFLRFVASGRWSGLFTHRVVPGFVVQAGRFVVVHGASGNASFVSLPDYGPITNEFGVGPRRSNTFGTLAMAKVDGDPNSATAEWFFNLADNSAELDAQNGGFTVFGHLIAGHHVLEEFNRFTWRLPLTQQPTNRLYYLGEPGPFNTSPLPPAFPVLNPLESAEQALTNVVGFRIQLEPFHAAPLTDGRAGITWTAIAGVSNRVEVASALTGPWTLLTSSMPSGAQPVVVDPDPSPGLRLYRVVAGE